MKSLKLKLLCLILFALTYARIYEDSPKESRPSRQQLDYSHRQIRSSQHSRFLKQNSIKKRKLLDPILFAGGAAAVSYLLNKFGYMVQQNQLEDLINKTEDQRLNIISKTRENKRMLKSLTSILIEFKDKTEVFTTQLRRRLGDYELYVKGKMQGITFNNLKPKASRH